VTRWKASLISAAVLLAVVTEVFLASRPPYDPPRLLRAVVFVTALLVAAFAVLSPSAARTIVASWRGITRQQLLLTFLLGCALEVYRMVVSINIRYAAFIFVGDQIKAFGLLLAIVAADGLTGKDADRRGVYALSVLLGAATIIPVSTAVIASLIWTFKDSSARPAASMAGGYLNTLFELLMVGGATAWVVNDRRRARRERDRMHAAELSRIEAERQSIESDLQAMQARVEPEFLFNTLAHVKRAYAHDAAQGARILDALIAYLRAAMPKMRETSSTVRQELDLVRAYLEIVQLRLGDRLTFAIEPPDDDVFQARMPAMLVLPLVDHAIAKSFGEWRATGSIRVQITIANERIRLALSQTGNFAEDDERILAIRERLTALYAGDASLAMQRVQPNRTDAVLEIPHRPAPSDEASRAEVMARAVA
jgi:histidine kinase